MQHLKQYNYNMTGYKRFSFTWACSATAKPHACSDYPSHYAIVTMLLGAAGEHLGIPPAAQGLDKDVAKH
jgi:hypothetical protein